MAYRGIVCHELGERLHGRGGDVVLRQQGEPMGTRLGAEAILEDRQERACVVVAQHPRGKARIVRELVEAERLAELHPERLIAAREEEPLAVAGLVEPVGGARAEARRLPRVLDRVAGLERQRAMKQRRLHALSAPGALAHEEAGEHRLRSERRRVVVGDGDAQVLRRSAVALKRHHSRHRLQQRIEARSIDVGPARAERGHGAIHEARVDLRQPGVAEAETIRDAGAHVLEEHVAGAHELLDHGDAVGRLEIQGHGLLAAVPRVEAGQLAERLAFERLDLDDGGTEVGEHHSGVGAGDVAGAVDHANALERRHAVTLAVISSRW